MFHSLDLSFFYPSLQADATLELKHLEPVSPESSATDNIQASATVGNFANLQQLADFVMQCAVTARETAKELSPLTTACQALAVLFNVPYDAATHSQVKVVEGETEIATTTETETSILKNSTLIFSDGFLHPQPMARQVWTQVHHAAHSPWCLIYWHGKLAIAKKGTGKKAQRLDTQYRPVAVDFCEGKAAFRLQQHVMGEQVVKACVKKGVPYEQQVILDATGGFGQDSMLLASTGARVIALERHPVISLLLADGLRRAHGQLDYGIELLYPSSISSDLAAWQAAQAHGTIPALAAIYLDPMYPHTKDKSAKVNKNMQLIQALVGTDADQAALLVAAQQLATQRIVVKRPKSAPFLNDQPTSDYLETPSHRFDYYRSK